LNHPARSAKEWYNYPKVDDPGDLVSACYTESDITERPKQADDQDVFVNETV
jgi:hypothetical protein